MLNKEKTITISLDEYNRLLESQKQVDELTEQRNKNYLKGEIIMKDEKTLLNEIKEHCGDCEAWSGTDCTRNPYTQGCLKDEKQVIECYGMLKGCDMVKQAVKDTAKKFAALVEFHSVSTRDENGREIFTISALGLKEILHEEFGIPYDEIAKEITQG